MAGDAFKKIKSSLNRSVTTISVKTSSSIEKVKLKTHMESLEADIQTSFTRLGEVAYQLWEADEKDTSSLEEHFEAILQKKEEIKKIQEEFDLIDQRNNQILGTNSIEENIQRPATNTVEITCPNCNISYSNLAKFCKKCGAKLQ